MQRSVALGRRSTHGSGSREDHRTNHSLDRETCGAWPDDDPPMGSRRFRKPLMASDSEASLLAAGLLSRHAWDSSCRVNLTRYKRSAAEGIRAANRQALVSG